MPSVLFVCVENSCRSQIAEGYALHLAGAGWTVASAGSRPSRSIHPRAVTFMQEDGIDLSRQRSKGLGEIPTLSWDAVVTMGCGDACPHVAARRRLDWDLPDPKNLPDEEFRGIRDEIRRRVEQLLRELTASATGS
ncbi:MAG: arsenate reductase ArsC [Acidobacteria bacterium]|nr:arsenate reductase ArsC [Acidobacteriota bacterium]